MAKTARATNREITLTGLSASCFEHIDDLVVSFVRKWDVPGVAFALSKNGKLMHARGYGYSSKETGEPVQPTSLFRIASISKSITAAAILTLIEEGSLSLGDRVFELLAIEPPDGKVLNKRLEEITVRHLLQHTGGWNSEKRPLRDPMFQTKFIAQNMGVEPPASAEVIIRYMLDQKLSFAPGKKYRYSNFGYCLLGRLIEKTSGMSYESYVAKSVLHPLSITRMQLGKTRAEHRAHDEVTYYQPNMGTRESVFSGTKTEVAAPYGSFCLESNDSSAGWIASVIDLLRFTRGLDFPDKNWQLTQDTIKQIGKRPEAPAWVSYGEPSSYYCGLGWFVRPVGAEQYNYWHSGNLPGTLSLLTRRADGTSFALLINQRFSGAPENNLYMSLHSAVDGVKSWPKHNLFPTFNK